MSKWTAYQWLVGIVFIALITIHNVFAVQITKVFSFIKMYIEPSVIIIFFSVIFIIWGFTAILLLQEKKGKPLFIHKIWQIMPAIFGVLLLLSTIGFIILGVTIFPEITLELRWILDMTVIYFLVLFYLFIFSIVLRYGKADTSKRKITISANAAVLILFAVLFLFPTI